MKILKMALLEKLFVLIFILSLYAVAVDAKKTSGTVKLSGVKTEKTLTKFSLSPYAKGKFDLVIKTKDRYYEERNLKVRLYREDDWWKGAKTASTCVEKIRFATKTIPLRFIQNGDYWETNPAHVLDSSQVSTKNYWYILIDDCSLESYFHDDKVPELHYEISILDDVSGPKSEGSSPQFSHLSADERGIEAYHSYAFWISVTLTIYIVICIIQTMKNNSGSVHASLLLVGLVCFYDAASNKSEQIHLHAYEKNGWGSYFFDACSSYFEALSDSTVAILLLFVGSGWTLPSDVLSNHNDNYSTLVKKIIAGFQMPASSLCQLEQGNPAALLIIFIHIVNTTLAQCSRLYDDDFDAYHSFEHFPGRVQMFLRSFLGFFFLMGVNSVRNSGKCPSSLRPFLYKFMIVGTIWFFLLPTLCFFVSKTADNHSKLQKITIANLSMQITSVTSLTWLFTASAQSSSYHRLSKVNEQNYSISDSISTNNPSHVPSVLKFGSAKVRID